MKKKPLLLLYIASGVIFFVFWFFVVFPYDALQSRIITEIENRTGGRYQIAMKDMDVSLFGSVTLEDLKVTERVGGQENLLLKTPKFELGFSPLGIFSNEIDFSFYLKGNKKGDIDGDIKKDGDEIILSVTFDEFPISDLKFLAQKAKVNFKGTIEGDVDLKFNPADPNQNDGDIDIKLSNLSMDPTKISMDPSDPSSAMEIPMIKITGAKGSHIKAKVVKDKLEISSFILTGGDLDLNLDGRITLRGKTPGDYRMAVQGGFKMSESLTKALPFLFILEQQKNAEGIYPLNLTGRLAKPNIRIGKFRIPI